MNTDRIEREVVIDAPIARVWSALTEPKSVSAWFSNGADVSIDLRVGGVMSFDQGDHGAFQTVIVSVTPPHVFSFRWASAYPGVLATEENSTLVEFSLKETPRGTVLRVVESGFDALEIPADRVQHAGFENHSKGWNSVVAAIDAYVMANLETSIIDSP
ncbi:MAG TPA: SRPBCC family protein [Acidimicrobiales bacterium]|nr:SRPBCC family protein [Acidimicrobiales bacterium]